MKQIKKHILLFFIILSCTLTTTTISPITANYISIEAATRKPAAITKITKSKATTSSLKIKIKKPKRAHGYQIHVYKGKSLIYTSNTKKTSLTINNLESDTTYKLKVRAYSKLGKKKIYGKAKSISYKTNKMVSPTTNTPNNTPTTSTDNLSNTASSTTTPGDYVYLSKTGTKYHIIPNCGTMNPNTARKITKQEALDKHYSPCSKCF